ncbi:MAG: hypothetical protein ACLUEV_04035 [Alistipes sp.]
MMRRLGHRKIKVGHAGATRSAGHRHLIVCLGRATKQAEALQAQPKEYLTTLALGATTPSFDMEHPVDRTFPYEHITRQMLEEALRTMEGEQMQLPPVYSAKSIDGKRAYEYARQGTEVEMRRAPVTLRDAARVSNRPGRRSGSGAARELIFVRSPAISVKSWAAGPT